MIEEIESVLLSLGSEQNLLDFKHHVLGASTGGELCTRCGYWLKHSNIPGLETLTREFLAYCLKNGLIIN